MKKFLLLLAFMVTLTPFISAQDNTAKQIDLIRGLELGMDMDQVKKTVKCEDYEKDKLIEYGALLDNKNATIYYDFIGNKLCNVAYYFDKLHTDLNIYLNDYEEVEKSLIEKYGPAKVEYIWNDNKYKDEKKYYGFAISRNMLAVQTVRAYNNGNIVHSLKGTEYQDVKHCLQYKNSESTKPETKK